jgi:hypothetical protein
LSIGYVAAITLAENLLEDGADVTTSGWGSIINGN